MALIFKDSNTILKYLGELPGVIAVSIVSRDGLVMESHVAVEFNLNALGTAVSAGFLSAEGVGADMEIGYLNHSIMEFEFGKILTAACGGNILAVVTNPDAIIGNIRYQMRKLVAELGKLV